MTRLRRAQRIHDGNLRFHLVLNLTLAAVSAGILKIDGPWYADAVIAALFACGFATSVFALRSLRRTRSAVLAAIFHPEEQPAPVSADAVFLLLAVFYLSAAVATLWLSYAYRDSGIVEDSGIAETVRGRREVC